MNAFHGRSRPAAAALAIVRVNAPLVAVQVLIACVQTSTSHWALATLNLLCALLHFAVAIHSSWRWGFACGELSAPDVARREIEELQEALEDARRQRDLLAEASR